MEVGSSVLLLMCWWKKEFVFRGVSYVRLIGLVLLIISVVIVFLDYNIAILLFGVALLLIGGYHLQTNNKVTSYIYFISGFIFFIGIIITKFQL